MRKLTLLFLSPALLLGSWIGPLQSLDGTFLEISSVHAQPSSATTRQGYTLLAEGRIDEAINTFEAALRNNPTDVEAQIGLAIAYRRANRVDEALAAYQRVLELDPDNRIALSTLGFLGEFRPEWQPIGIEALTRLLSLEPNNLEARAQRAKLYFYQGLFSESLADYSVVLPRTQDPEVVGTAAEAYTYSGDYETGLALFNRYRTLGGTIAGDRSIAYAQALRESGRIAEAAQILTTELSRTPDLTTQNIRLRGALATTYAANDQFAEALQIIQPLRGRMDSRLTLARALTAIGEYSQQPAYVAEAVALYQNVLATEINLSPGTRREAATVMARLPEYQLYALQILQQLAQAYPNDQSLTFLQQILAYETGSLSRTEFVQTVQSTFPNLPADPVQVRYMGQYLSRVTPPVPELLPLYQSLLAAGANDAFLHFRVAQILADQGQFAEAKSSLATYAASPAGNRDADTVQLLLADIERQEGNLEASEQRFQALLSTTQKPNIREGALQGLAAVYEAQGRYSEAIAVYDQLIAENPQDFTKQLGRATVAYQAGFISEAEALAILDQGLQRYPLTDPPPELINLAVALPPQPNRNDLYQALLAAEPTNIGLQLKVLQGLAETDPQQAKVLIAQRIAQDPNNLNLYLIQGQIAQQIGDEDLARQSYTAVLQRQPNNLDALLALAGLEFQAGNYNEANDLYRQALAIDNRNGIANTSLAALRSVQGYPLEAIDQLKTWQRWQLSQGIVDPAVDRQIQQIAEILLQQRGIQPYWERF